MRTLNKDTQTHLTPNKAFEILSEGNNRNLLQQVNETSEGQYPFAIVLSCIDSRTSAELIFDQGLGDIFSARIAGNVLNEDILGSMEFACQVAGSKLIVVLGHTKCGAIKGACSHVKMGHLTGLLNKVGPALHEVELREGRNLAPDLMVETVALENVRYQLRSILERSPILEHLYQEGRIGLVGGVYSVESGEVTFLEQHFKEVGQQEPVKKTGTGS
jgi:carbonic anhydrase